MSKTDFVIVGGGIVGLATAMEVQKKYSDAKVTVVEAEPRVAEHQTGRNSGVLHSGIYYRPGSVKATTCRTGKLAMESFCDEHAIPWDRCGKVVVATSETELESLEKIQIRAGENGVQAKRIHSDELRELEPHVAGIAGLHVPETGIVSYRTVAEKMAELIVRHGGQIRLSFAVRRINVSGGDVSVTGQSGESISCDHVINCGGLHSDRICEMTGLSPEVRIIPFRGEYYDLVTERRSLCRNLIYPVPDPSFPFLGVHFTRMIDGSVECGPNAVLALAREGYRWNKINLRDLAGSIGWGGFRKLARRHWRTGLGEIHRSLSKRAFVKALQRLIPSLTSSDLVGGRAGVRAQAVSPDGNLVDDFLIQTSDRATHVLNAPSPAATASLAIAEKVVSMVR